jgi:hypothetical protein
LLYCQQICRTTARRRSGIRGGDDNDNDRDLGRNLHRAWDLHLEFGHGVELFLGLNNGGKHLLPLIFAIVL